MPDLSDNTRMRDYDGNVKTLRSKSVGTSNMPVHFAETLSVAPSMSAPAVSNLIVATTPGCLYEAWCHALVDGYFWMFDAITMPANGVRTPLIVPKRVLADSWFSYSPKKPLAFTTGLVLAFSSTLNTAGAWNFTSSAQAIFDAQKGVGIGQTYI